MPFTKRHRSESSDRSSFVYFLPTHDCRAAFTKSPDQILTVLRHELTKHIDATAIPPPFKITRQEVGEEIHFLIQNHHQPSHHRSFRRTRPGATAPATERSEDYDFVAYNKTHGYLRMLTKRQRDRFRYRVAFGQALFGSAHIFAAKTDAISLEPLKGKCADIFNCQDIDGLAEVDPVELAFHRLQEPDKAIILRAANKSTLLASLDRQPTLVPDDADTVCRAIVRYRLEGQEAPVAITINQGNIIDFAPEGHAPAMEKWFCRRGIIRRSIDTATWLAIILTRLLIDLDDIIPDGFDDLIDAVT